MKRHNSVDAEVDMQTDDTLACYIIQIRGSPAGRILSVESNVVLILRVDIINYAVIEKLLMIVAWLYGRIPVLFYLFIYLKHLKTQHFAIFKMHY